MNSIPYSEFLRLASPQVCMVIAAFVVLTTDLFLRREPLRVRFGVAVALATLGCVVAATLLAKPHDPVDLMHGMWVTSRLTAHVQMALVALTVTTLLLSANSTFTKHVGEYVLLILLATVGMMFLVNSRDVMVTFVSLELLSLSLYALTAFDTRRPKSAEAALKYFLFGGASAAFLLYGLSLVYGLTHATGYADIALALSTMPITPLLALAMTATIVGFGFKVAAVPFHFWAPDVYEGAPAPVAGLIASSSKVASFFAFYVLMDTCFSALGGRAEWTSLRAGWVPLIAASAALSMLIGNLGALVQSGVRRLLAYSAVANAGYMLIAFVAHTQQSFNALLYYVFTYSLSTLGAFAVTAAVEAEVGSDQLSSFDGLSRRSPLLSGCMMVFLLSQIGIPPLAGFFGKFYLFVSALRAEQNEAGLVWIVILALGLSAVSLYYYLQVLKRIYIGGPSDATVALKSSWLTRSVVVLLALSVIAAGCAPETLMRWFAIR